MPKFVYVLALTFLLAGLALSSASYIAYNNTQRFLTVAQETSGVIVDIETRHSRNSEGRSSVTHAPVVEFTYNGQKTRFTSQSSSSSRPQIGQEVGVLFNPESPQQARINSWLHVWGTSVLTGIMGTMFLAFPLGFFGIMKMLNQRKRRAQQSGTRFKAKVLGVEKNNSLRVNGRSPWVIQCQWQDPKSSVVYLYRSENFWYNPQEFLQGDTIDVMVDTNNPAKNYWVDTDFLKSKKVLAA